MNEDSDDEMQKKGRKSKRSKMRGRKSKYLNEIDMEDDEEATYEQRKVD